MYYWMLNYIENGFVTSNLITCGKYKICNFTEILKLKIKINMAENHVTMEKNQNMP